MFSKVIDETGNRHGRLLVLRRSENIRGNATWVCRCDCGNEVVVVGTYLRNGYTKSCSCLQKERAAAANRLPPTEEAFNRLFDAYKIRAKKRNFDFGLSKELFRNLVTQGCYYCGVPPAQIRKPRNGNGSFVYNGIDRVDNRMGYTLKNVVPCCKQCNFVKGVMSQDEFYNWVHRVCGHFRGSR